MKIGFIGQGWIGKNYADDFEERGQDVVRYGLQDEYINNKEAIGDCEIVFIAVPAETKPDGFDDSNIKEALAMVSEKTIVVIKSTMPPGTTEKFQDKHPDIYVLHSPEFLTTGTAKDDTSNPSRNIIGVPKLTGEYTRIAEQVLTVMAPAPYVKITHSTTAEISKYLSNCYWNFKNMYINLMFDLTESVGGDWDELREMFIADPRTGDDTHTMPVHKGGRGAGNACLIKDMAAIRNMFDKKVGDENGLAVLDAIAAKNVQYLFESGKDLDLVEGVYGKDFKKKLKID